VKDKKRLFTIMASLFIAFVFSQSLFFKFTGAPETQYIFGILDTWAGTVFDIDGLFLPPGIFNAYVIGTTELIATILLLIGLYHKCYRTTALGALLAFGVISGAIFFHLFTPLGVDVQGDGGALFFMACGVWFCAATLVVTNKQALLSWIKR
jgi:uncharacterized membrane protein YphA (DoxX/SURF4 family)